MRKSRGIPPLRQARLQLSQHGATRQKTAPERYWVPVNGKIYQMGGICPPKVPEFPIPGPLHAGRGFLGDLSLPGS